MQDVLDVDVLHDLTQKELAFAEPGSPWHTFLTRLDALVLEWLDTPDEERLG